MSPKKSTKKSGTRTSIGSESIKDVKKSYAFLIAEDPQFFRGSSTFKFPNGDEYEGEFCAHATGLVWRQGKGTYTTNDEQIYKGYWDGDKLDETKDVEISYPDGTKYIGSLLKNKYSGPGIYQFEDKVSLMTNFVENKPTGDITLFDPNEKFWHGLAEKDESLLIREHAFYNCIGKDLGKGRLRTKSPKETANAKGDEKSDTSSSKGPKYSDVRDDEKQLFAKSKKVPSDLDFQNSEWYQEYANYKTTYGDIVCKAKNTGEMSLTAEEYDWYIRYKEFERRYLALLNNVKIKTKRATQSEKLFEMIHSEEYRIRNKPVPVYFPREESEDDCDSVCECDIK